MSSTAFTKLLGHVVDGASISQSATNICGVVCEQVLSASSAIYLYNRLNNNHELVGSVGTKNYPSILTEIRECKVLKSFRGEFVCGALVVDSSVPVHDAFLADVVRLIALLSERSFCFEMFRRSGRPVNFQQDELSFFYDLQNLTRESSQMPAGAFRLNEEGRLRSVFAWNDWNVRDFHREDWDIDVLDSVPCIEECMTGGVPVILKKSDLKHPFFQKSMQQGVNAAVFCPVLVGSEPVGMLSFAMPVKYNFSQLEVSGFLNLANSIGVSVANFNASAQAGLQLHEDVRNSQMLTAVEVAQAARHSAKAELDSLKINVMALKHLSQDARPLDIRKDLIETSAECDILISSCFKSLEDIKSAIRPPKKELERILPSALFERAKSQLLGRVNKYRVDMRFDFSKETFVECYPDHLTQVFLNLMLNSLDAFSSSSKLNGRRVICRIHDLQPKVDQIRLRFEDNAGGINVAKLRQISEDHDSSVEELVFQKDLTTKGKEGSGWGLFVSRRIVEFQGGHLALIEYRGRTVFELTLPKKAP